MKIALKDIPAYALCCDKYPQRIKDIMDMCLKLNIHFTKINSNTTEYSRQQNIAYDALNLLFTAISNNVYPFILFEDDATLIDTIPEIIDVPADADLIYWGANIKSLPPVTKVPIYLSNYNDNYYRICHSQSGHALLIPNKNSAMFLKDIYSQTLITNVFSDILLPNVSENKLFLTPKDGPYFYQNDGQNNNITKVKWSTSSYLIK